MPVYTSLYEMANCLSVLTRATWQKRTQLALKVLRGSDVYMFVLLIVVFICVFSHDFLNYSFSFAFKKIRRLFINIDTSFSKKKN